MTPKPSTSYEAIPPLQLICSNSPHFTSTISTRSICQKKGLGFLKMQLTHFQACVSGQFFSKEACGSLEWLLL